MNDLHYILYESKRMFLDTSDMTCEGNCAHRRLCDYIWFSDGPPLNQNKFLRQLTLIEESQWSSVKRELLRKGWLEIGEYLLHRGVIKSLNESKVKYVENFNRQAKMNKAVPLALSPPDAVTGVVTIVVTDIVTSTVTPTVTRTQSESQSESVPNRERGRKPAAREPDFPEANVPTWEDVRKMAESSAIPEKTARSFFDHYDSKNLWRNKHDVMIKVRECLLIWNNNERSRPKNSPPGRTNPRLAGQADDVETKRASVAAARLASERK